jgi:hypothetical protein
MMEAVGTSGASVTFYLTTLHSIPEDSYVQLGWRGSCKAQLYALVT